ncbi:MAG TPA: GFA family protein [Minicystis sp.]|nr:GFA family protein [Minicystis sp.]
MSDATTYEGSCHCGAVRYAVTMAPPEKAMSCNCSICSRNGWLLTFVPRSAFELRTGEDALQDDQFGKKHIHHLFCRTCGVRSFSRGAGPGGQEMVAVNLRCLAGLDATALPVQTFDGASL